MVSSISTQRPSNIFQIRPTTDSNSEVPKKKKPAKKREEGFNLWKCICNIANKIWNFFTGGTLGPKYENPVKERIKKQFADIKKKERRYNWQTSFHRLYNKYRFTLYKNEFIEIAAEEMPIETLEYFNLSRYPDLLRKVAIHAPLTVLENSSTFANYTHRRKILAEAKRQKKMLDGLHETAGKGFEVRRKYLKGTLKDLNSNFNGYLSMFNTTHRTNLDCLGINSGNMHSSNPFEFVFVDFVSNEPVRVGLSTSEIESLKTYEEFETFMQEKINTEKSKNGEQYLTWRNNSDNYSFPKSKNTKVMLFGVPKQLSGVEQDLSEALELYDECTISSVCMQKTSTWEGVAPQDGLPIVEYGGRDEILRGFRETLIAAIDENDGSTKPTAIIHSMAHGHTLENDHKERDGELYSKETGFIMTSTGRIYARDFAKILSEEHNGKTLAEQVDISFNMEYCRSKAIQDDLTADLVANGIPTKKLRVYATSEPNKASAMGFNIYSASIINDRMVTGDETGNYNSKNPKDVDYSGGLSYYSTLAYDYLEYLQSKGIELPVHATTDSHILKITDMMSNYDSHTRQNGSGSEFSQDETGVYYKDFTAIELTENENLAAA